MSNKLAAAQRPTRRKKRASDPEKKPDYAWGWIRPAIFEEKLTKLRDQAVLARQELPGRVEKFRRDETAAVKALEIEVRVGEQQLRDYYAKKSENRSRRRKPFTVEKVLSALPEGVVAAMTEKDLGVLKSMIARTVPKVNAGAVSGRGDVAVAVGSQQSAALQDPAAVDAAAPREIPLHLREITSETPMDERRAIVAAQGRLRREAQAREAANKAGALQAVAVPVKANEDQADAVTADPVEPAAPAVSVAPAPDAEITSQDNKGKT